MVEWNPPPDRPPLAEALRWPEDTGPCEIRIITVPREIHANFDHADTLPLFQMIAKNVGIRRARGDFVLATNIDILFSNESIRYLKERLRAGRLYRANRYDIPAELPETERFEETLDFCRRTAFRVHANGFTYLREGKRWNAFTLIKARMDPRMRYLVLWLPRRIFQRDAWVRAFQEMRHFRENMRSEIDRVQYGGKLRKAKSFVVRITRSSVRLAKRIWGGVRRRVIDPWLFTNACGDFTLLFRNDWFRLRGYPEWAMYSFHIDSILLHQAYYHGIREINLGAPAAIYHIDHEAGSGYTPEAADKLFARLKARGIPCLDWIDDVQPMIREMEKTHRDGGIPLYNTENWGLGGVDFPDQIVRPADGGRPGDPVSTSAGATMMNDRNLAAKSAAG